MRLADWRSRFQPRPDDEGAAVSGTELGEAMVSAVCHTARPCCRVSVARRPYHPRASARPRRWAPASTSWTRRWALAVCRLTGGSGAATCRSQEVPREWTRQLRWVWNSLRSLVLASPTIDNMNSWISIPAGRGDHFFIPARIHTKS